MVCCNYAHLYLHGTRSHSFPRVSRNRFLFPSPHNRQLDTLGVNVHVHVQLPETLQFKRGQRQPHEVKVCKKFPFATEKGVPFSRFC